MQQEEKNTKIPPEYLEKLRNRTPKEKSRRLAILMKELPPFPTLEHTPTKSEIYLENIDKRYKASQSLWWKLLTIILALAAIVGVIFAALSYFTN